MNCVQLGEKHDWVFSPELTSKSARFTCARCGCLGRYHHHSGGTSYIGECSSSSEEARILAEKASTRADVDVSKILDAVLVDENNYAELDEYDEELCLFEQCVMRAGADHRWSPPGSGL